jgi:Chain length determinant protein
MTYIPITTAAATAAESLSFDDCAATVNGNQATAARLVASDASGSDNWAWGWLLWERRRFLIRAVVWGLAVSLLAAFVIPKRYSSTTRLMPPDGQSGSSLAMLAAMAGKGGLGVGSLAGGLLGMKSSGALFVEILRSRTVEDRIVPLRSAQGLWRPLLDGCPQASGRLYRDCPGPQE